MSNVPPLRPDDVALVAAWPARGDCPADIARDLSVVLRAISAIEPGITGWKRQRAKTVATSDDVDALTDMIERGAVKDSQRPPVHIKEYGYLQWLDPVGVRGIQVLIAAGQTADRAISSCTVQISTRAPRLRTAAVAHALMRAIVEAFDPAWATWTAPPLADDDHLTADNRTLGYLNYGDPAQMFALDPNAALHGRGAIAQLGDDPELRDPAVVLRHLSPAGDPPLLAQPPDEVTVLVPIGMPLGMELQEGRSDTAFRVRLGRQVYVLDDDRLGAWFLAHTMDHDHASLARGLQHDGVADPRTAIGSLISGGLLKEFRVGAEGALLLAAQYRLLPLMEGLGADGPGEHLLGVPGQTRHQVDDLFLEVYRRATSAPTLLAALVAAAADEQAATAGLRVDVLATEFFRRLAQSKLLEKGVVALDLGRAS